MFDRFDEHRVALDDATVFVRTAGIGAPVLLLHGYPQTSAIWHLVAPQLASRFCVVAPDLPGYGASDAPDGGPPRYAKRRMAADLIAVMARLGHARFAVVGHDRGGRVGYRMALDAPDKVRSLAVLDIVPTGALWAGITPEWALRYWHWTFLAQPSPVPEALIGADPVGWLRRTMAGWTKAGDLSAFATDAFEEYAAAFSRPDRLRASCDDYRAGASLDREADDATLASGTRIAAPLLVLWGAAWQAAGGRSPLEVWRQWADEVEGEAIDAGHFLAEENPAATIAALTPFLERTAD